MLGASRLNTLSRVLGAAYTQFAEGGTETEISVGTTVTAVNDAQLSTSQKKFGTASVYFDGTSDALTSDPVVVANGTDWTVEFWWYAETTNEQYMFFTGAYSTNDYRIAYNSGVKVYIGGEGVTISGPTVSADTWHHIALVMTGGDATLYVNGTDEGSRTMTSSEGLGNSANDYILGAFNAAGADNKEMYIDEFRISKIARYTSGFTPSASAFTTDANTRVLLHFDGTNGSTTFTDSSAILHRVHTFNSGDTFTVNESLDVEYLLIAGGGSGGSTGGGGAGGLVHNIGGTLKTLSADDYTIVIGNGGAYSGGGLAGADSTALGLTAKGGGPGRTQSGNDGGSGGGAGQSSTSYTGGSETQTGQAGESGTNGYGNDGGDNAGNAGAGGGGGSAQAGGNGGGEQGGDGGDGLQLNINGTATYYAGGGAGYGDTTPGTAGLGGGGDARVGGTPGTAGGTNLGGGGGGLAGGGSGLFIVRYPITDE